MTTTGLIFTLNGGPIHLYSWHQTITALSTCEAEYIAVSTATQNTAWIGPHVQELLGTQGIAQAVPVGVDNQGAIALAKKDGWNRRMRHINVRYQYVQQAVREGAVNLLFVATEEQLADGLTKALRAELFERWKERMGL
jgi:predicted solute-binding protein